MKKKYLLKLLPLYFRTLSVVAPKKAAEKAFQLFTSPIKIPRPPSEKKVYDSAEKIGLKNGLRAYRWGQTNHPIVVLLHGWNGRGTQLRAYVEPLTQKGYQVVALDGPAHGESPGTFTTPRQFADILQSTQAELGEFHALIAHSFGAGCSVVACSEGLKVQKLVLIASPCHYEHIMARFCQMIGLNKKAKNFFYQKMEMATHTKADSMVVSTLGQKLRPPTLILHDAEDRDVPVGEAQKLIAAWPDARALITTGLGHIRILRNPHVVEQVVQFINER